MRMKQLLSLFIVSILILPQPLLALTPDDSSYHLLWHLDKIGAEEAWDITTGSADIIIAVIDAGIDGNHEDLEGNYWVNPGEIPGNGLDDEGNGFIDDDHGWDFVHQDNTPTPVTGVGSDFGSITHGTIIAGLIGAVGDNDQGIAGINWSVKVMVLRALTRAGFGNSSDIADAVDYAVDNGADVINLSLAGDLNDPSLENAVERAFNNNVTVVVAAGNEGRNTDLVPSYPSCNASFVIGVASSTSDDDISDFSNYGEDCIDISAPGESIYSTQFHNESKGYDDPYGGFWQGTSFAAPIVAGAAGLLLAAYPDLTPTEIKTIIQLTADPMDVTGPYIGKVGSGRLNLGAAMAAAPAFSDGDAAELPDGPNPDPEPLPEGDPTELDGVLTGDFIKAPSFSSVYLIDDEGGRRAFINDAAYFTHSDSFGEITDVLDGDLSVFAVTGLALPRPGVVLVKIASDPRVYLLEDNPADPYAPRIRAIDTEAIAIVMYGENWADYIIDIEPTFFTKFTPGTVVSAAFAVDTSIMKTRDELAALSN
jgi:subtilisin family serine protease